MTPTWVPYLRLHRIHFIMFTADPNAAEVPGPSPSFVVTDAVHSLHSSETSAFLHFCFLAASLVLLLLHLQT